MNVSRIKHICYQLPCLTACWNEHLPGQAVSEELHTMPEAWHYPFQGQPSADAKKTLPDWPPPCSPQSQGGLEGHLLLQGTWLDCLGTANPQPHLAAIELLHIIMLSAVLQI